MSQTVLNELQTALKTRDTDPVLLAGKVNKLNDNDWENLSKPAQRWVNQTLAEVEKAQTEKRAPQIEPPQGSEELAKADDKSNGAAHADAAEKEPEPEVQTKPEEKVEEPTKPDAEPRFQPAKGARTGRPRTVSAASKPKTATPAAKPVVAKGGKRLAMPDDAKITVLKKSPYTEGTLSDKRFKRYTNGMTVAAALKAGVPRNQLLENRQNGLISTEGGTAGRKKYTKRTNARGSRTLKSAKQALRMAKTRTAAPVKMVAVGEDSLVASVLGSLEDFTPKQLKMVEVKLAELSETDAVLKKLATKMPKLTPAIMNRLMMLQGK